MIGRRLALIGLLALTALVGCGEADDPEARLRQAIADGEQAVEERSLLRAAEFISSDYRDAHGMDKRAITRILLGYLHRHRNIHLLSRVQSIDLDDSGKRAEVVLLVAMADVPLASIESLRFTRADLHHFDMQFVDGEAGWQVISVAWRRARLDELLPFQSDG